MLLQKNGEGKPTFEEKVFVGKPVTEASEGALAHFRESLQSGWLTNNGPKIQRLEKELSSLLQVKHAVCVANATLGLQLTLQAEVEAKRSERTPEEEEEKKEIIVPAWTFVATAHAVEMAGFRCVFCDCDEKTHLIRVEDIAACITPRTFGVVGVHLWGVGCDVEGIEKFCAEKGVSVFYDAAHAFGARIGDKMIGGFGRCEIFSFHATKFFSCAEGGVITTNDDTLAEKCRLLRNFGFLGTDNVGCLGTNAKMSEFHAGLGLSNLELLPKYMQKSWKVWSTYYSLLNQIEGLEMIDISSGYVDNSTESNSPPNNFQYVVCHVDTEKFGLTRDQIVNVLDSENIVARRYFFPGVHRSQPYRQRTHRSLPVTDKLTGICFLLPGGPALPVETAVKIAGVLKAASLNAEKLRAYFDANSA